MIIFQNKVEYLHTFEISYLFNKVLNITCDVY